MAGYGKLGATIRIISLLVIIFLLLFGITPLLFRVLGLPSIGNPLFDWITRSMGITASPAVSGSNSMDLIEQERLEILRFNLDNREFEITQKESQLENLIEELKVREEILIAQEKDLESRAEIIDIRMKSLENLDENLLRNAQNLSNMPPTRAVAILENIENDRVLIDHLYAADRYAARQGITSLSSVWISMMDPVRAGRVLEKMSTL